MSSGCGIAWLNTVAADSMLCAAKSANSCWLSPIWWTYTCVKPGLAVLAGSARDTAPGPGRTASTRRRLRRRRSRPAASKSARRAVAPGRAIPASASVRPQLVRALQCRPPRPRRRQTCIIPSLGLPAIRPPPRTPRRAPRPARRRDQTVADAGGDLRRPRLRSRDVDPGGRRAGEDTRVLDPKCWP